MICILFFDRWNRRTYMSVCDKAVLNLRSVIPGDFSHRSPFSHAPLATSTPHRLLALFILLFFTLTVFKLHAVIFLTLYTFHAPLATSTPYRLLALFILLLFILHTHCNFHTFHTFHTY